MIAGNATPSDARMMWKPSVKAIWLRAASRLDARGMAAVMVGIPPRGRTLRGTPAPAHHPERMIVGARVVGEAPPPDERRAATGRDARVRRGRRGARRARPR